MLPSTSAYTMFCAGTSNSAAASRKSFQLCARFRSNSASAVRPGSSAVQRSATAYPDRFDEGVSTGSPEGPTGGRSLISRSPMDASDSSGPSRVPPTVTVTGFPPATLMVSVRTSSGSHSPSTSYRSPSTRSRYRSVTSGPRLVKPHAMRSLWPITTPGTPENVNPARFSPHPQCSPIWNQIPGMVGARCGSLASNGLPVVVRDPAMTHEFEPMPEAFVPSIGGKRRRPSRTASRTGPASRIASLAVPAGPFAGALDPVATNAPPASSPLSTIGRLRPKGYGGYSCSTCARLKPLASRVARSISSVMLPRRSQAIALSQDRLATGVHRPEAFLRVDVPLRAEQVLGGVGVHLRDAVVVAVDGHGRGQAGEASRTGVLRERTAYRPDGGDREHEGQRGAPGQQPEPDPP